MIKTSWQIPLLKLMLQSRAADKREAILIRQGKAPTHLSCSGHEALMAITYQLEKEDYLYPYPRGCHLMMGKGLNRREIAQDFLAKANSSSGGRSMSIHSGSRELNIFPGTAPTASQCIPAAGTAWGQKLLKQKFITVCSTGEGATREGEFFEAISFSIEHQLPIIFIIEDNHYAISTPTKSMSPFHLKIFDSSHFLRVNGSDVLEVYGVAEKAINKARSNNGPSILWCEVDRLDSHTAGEDHNLYRSKEELLDMKDPIVIFKEKLIKGGYITDQDFNTLKEEAENDILNSYQAADKEEEPDANDIRKHLYGPLIEHNLLPHSLGKDTTMVKSLNHVLDKGLSTYPNIIMFGQDIEAPKGGVFGFTKNLSTKYPDRVINAPIAESTIIGTAVGLSALGFLPVFEIQFIDFITPGFDQLVTQVSTLRWRSNGQWCCPLVLYAPYGAYLPSGGLWHSQSNEGWWTHIPGLRVAIPSNSEDVLDLFWAAFQDKDPSLILIPKHIFRKKTQLTARPLRPFGKLRIVQPGNDVTVICWGNTVELVEQAAMIAKNQDISVEILDLRSLVPCDWEGVEKSLSKTGRLVVVHEDNKTGGFGSSIIAEVVSNKKYSQYLYSMPQLVARDDIHIPFHAKLEYAVLPSVASIYNSITKTINE